MNSIQKLREAMKKNSSQGSKDYFQLKDHGDSAVVVFLHGGDDPHIDYGTVYEVKLPIRGENKEIKKYVKEIDKNTDPLGKNGYRTRVRALFQLIEINPDTGEYSDIKIWDRGPQHIDQILTYMEELGSLDEIPFKIKRDGAKGDRNTKYNIIPLTNKANLIDKEKLPEPSNLTEEGKYIMELTQEEMQQVVDGTYYLEPFNKDDNDGGDKSSTTDAIRKRAENAFSSKKEPEQTSSPKKGNTKKNMPTPPPPVQMPDGTYVSPAFNKETNAWYYPQQDEDDGEQEGTDEKTNVF